MEKERYTYTDLVLLVLDDVASKLSKQIKESLGITWKTPTRGKSARAGLDRSHWLWHSYPAAFFVGAIADLFSLAPANMLVRQFIRDVLKGVPTDTNTQPQLAATLRGVLHCEWSYLLNVTCKDAAFILTLIRKKLKQERDDTINRQQQAQTESIQEDPAHTNLQKRLSREPIPFSYEEKTYDFPYMQSLLLHSLRSRRSVAVLDVLQEVWGENTCTDAKAVDRLRKLQFDTNNRLLKFKLPLQVTRPVQNKLFLQKVTTR